MKIEIISANVIRIEARELVYDISDKKEGLTVIPMYDGKVASMKLKGNVLVVKPKCQVCEGDYIKNIYYKGGQNFLCKKHKKEFDRYVKWKAKR